MRYIMSPFICFFCFCVLNTTAMHRTPKDGAPLSREAMKNMVIQGLTTFESGIAPSFQKHKAWTNEFEPKPVAEQAKALADRMAEIHGKALDQSQVQAHEAGIRNIGFQKYVESLLCAATVSRVAFLKSFGSTFEGEDRILFNSLALYAGFSGAEPPDPTNPAAWIRDALLNVKQWETQVPIRTAGLKEGMRSMHMGSLRDRAFYERKLEKATQAILDYVRAKPTYVVVQNAEEAQSIIDASLYIKGATLERHKNIKGDSKPVVKLHSQMVLTSRLKWFEMLAPQKVAFATLNEKGILNLDAKMHQLLAARQMAIEEMQAFEKLQPKEPGSTPRPEFASKILEALGAFETRTTALPDTDRAWIDSHKSLDASSQEKAMLDYLNDMFKPYYAKSPIGVAPGTFTAGIRNLGFENYAETVLLTARKSPTAFFFHLRDNRVVGEEDKDQFLELANPLTKLESGEWIEAARKRLEEWAK